jgi:hypothetical protein
VLNSRLSIYGRLGGKPQDASFIKSLRRGKRADFERLKIVVALLFAAHN